MSDQPQQQPAEQAPAEQGEKKAPKRGGRGFGKGKGNRRGPRDQKEEDWVPLTNLGRLVKMGLVTKLEQIFYHSIPIKEYQIVDELVKKNNKTLNGHIGVGSKLAKEVQVAMKGAVIAAKLNIVPVRRGYWGGKIGLPHTLATKITGKCGSVRLRLIPAPKGTGIIGAPPTKKLLGFAGVEDIFSQSTGSTDTMENFVRAIYDALYKSYKYLSPELWNLSSNNGENIFVKYNENLKQYKANPPKSQ